MSRIEPAAPPASARCGANGDTSLALARQTQAAFGRLRAEKTSVAATKQSQRVVAIAQHLLRLADALGCEVRRSPTPCFAGNWPDVPYLARANHCIDRILVMLAARVGTHSEREAALQTAYTLLHMDCERHGFALDARLGSQEGLCSSGPRIAARGLGGRHERNPARHALQGR